MKLHAPFIVSPRLLPALQIADATISLQCVTMGNGRHAQPWFLIDIGEQTFNVRDIRGPASHGGTFKSMPEMFATLLSFMDACGESVRHGERTGRAGDNADLFEHGLAQWCAEHGDELAMIRMDICDESDAVRHDLIIDEARSKQGERRSPLQSIDTPFFCP